MVVNEFWTPASSGAGVFRNKKSVQSQAVDNNGLTRCTGKADRRRYSHGDTLSDESDSKDRKYHGKTGSLVRKAECTCEYCVSQLHVRAQAATKDKPLSPRSKARRIREHRRKSSTRQYSCVLIADENIDVVDPEGEVANERMNWALEGRSYELKDMSPPRIGTAEEDAVDGESGISSPTVSSPAASTPWASPHSRPSCSPQLPARMIGGSMSDSDDSNHSGNEFFLDILEPDIKPHEERLGFEDKSLQGHEDLRKVRTKAEVDTSGWTLFNSLTSWIER